MSAGRPRTSIPTREELIELGKDLVDWASEQTKKTDPIRVRFCDWYTDQGFVRKQWESFHNLPEFSWYYEKARSLMGLRYIDGTVNQSIAHRYLSIYDPEVREHERAEAEFNHALKAASLTKEVETQERLRAISDAVERNKPKPCQDKRTCTKDTCSDSQNTHC